MEMIKEKSKAEQIQQEFAEFKLSKGKEANALLNSVGNPTNALYEMPFEIERKDAEGKVINTFENKPKSVEIKGSSKEYLQYQFLKLKENGIDLKGDLRVFKVGHDKDGNMTFWSKDHPVRLQMLKGEHLISVPKTIQDPKTNEIKVISEEYVRAKSIDYSKVAIPVKELGDGIPEKPIERKPISVDKWAAKVRYSGFENVPSDSLVNENFYDKQNNASKRIDSYMSKVTENMDTQMKIDFKNLVTRKFYENAVQGMDINAIENPENKNVIDRVQMMVNEGSYISKEGIKKDISVSNDRMKEMYEKDPTIFEKVATTVAVHEKIMNEEYGKAYNRYRAKLNENVQEKGNEIVADVAGKQVTEEKEKATTKNKSRAKSDSKSKGKSKSKGMEM